MEDDDPRITPRLGGEGAADPLPRVRFLAEFRGHIRTHPTRALGLPEGTNRDGSAEEARSGSIWPNGSVPAQGTVVSSLGGKNFCPQANRASSLCGAMIPQANATMTPSVYLLGEHGTPNKGQHRHCRCICLGSVVSPNKGQHRRYAERWVPQANATLRSVSFTVGVFAWGTWYPKHTVNVPKHTRRSPSIVRVAPVP